MSHGHALKPLASSASASSTVLSATSCAAPSAAAVMSHSSFAPVSVASYGPLAAAAALAATAAASSAATVFFMRRRLRRWPRARPRDDIDDGGGDCGYSNGDSDSSDSGRDSCERGPQHECRHDRRRRPRRRRTGQRGRQSPRQRREKRSRLRRLGAEESPNDGAKNEIAGGDRGESGDRGTAEAVRESAGAATTATPAGIRDAVDECALEQRASDGGREGRRGLTPGVNLWARRSSRLEPDEDDERGRGNKRTVGANINIYSRENIKENVGDALDEAFQATEPQQLMSVGRISKNRNPDGNKTDSISGEENADILDREHLPMSDGKIEFNYAGSRIAMIPLDENRGGIPSVASSSVDFSPEEKQGSFTSHTSKDSNKNSCEVGALLAEEDRSGSEVSKDMEGQQQDEQHDDAERIPERKACLGANNNCPDAHDFQPERVYVRPLCHNDRGNRISSITMDGYGSRGMKTSFDNDNFNNERRSLSSHCDDSHMARISSHCDDSHSGRVASSRRLSHNDNLADVDVNMPTKHGLRPISRSNPHHNEPERNSTVSWEESYVNETTLKFKGEGGVDTETLRSASDESKAFPDSLRLLRRTRAVSALANRLMAAPDEATCYEESARLLVLLFGLERVSFAMVTENDHFLLKRVNVRWGDDSAPGGAFDLEALDSDFGRPLAGTAAGECVRDRRQVYTPRTRDSPYDVIRVHYRNGYGTAIATPILVNGNKCAGAILLSAKGEDAFARSDRLLISDIGLMMGMNIYVKRLFMQAEQSRRRSREMLHSFIPPKVLEKIECHWDGNPDERMQSGRSTVISTGSPVAEGLAEQDGGGDNLFTKGSRTDRSNAWYVAQSGWTEKDIEHGLGNDNDVKEGDDAGEARRRVNQKIRLIKNMSCIEPRRGRDEGVVMTRDGSEGDAAEDFSSPITRALYAESVDDVCILFADIVGFSKMSLKLTPWRVMDMLHSLFSRFDELCEVHGVHKLETIGDAYICATNLMDDGGNSARDAAIRALAMAKDMVIEAMRVRIPYDGPGSSRPRETLSIRVGLHVGDITCGVLGQRLPKFIACGTAVNMAARMEQTSRPGIIRATKDFRDLVGDAELEWSEMEVIRLKNMGTIETYLLNPLEARARRRPSSSLGPE